MMINAKITDVNRFAVLVNSLLRAQSQALTTEQAANKGVVARFFTPLVYKADTQSLDTTNIGFELSAPPGTEFKSLKVNWVDQSNATLQQRTTCKNLHTLMDLLIDQIVTMPNGICFVFQWLRQFLLNVGSHTTTEFIASPERVKLFTIGRYNSDFGNSLGVPVELLSKNIVPYSVVYSHPVKEMGCGWHATVEQAAASIMNNFGVEGSVSKTINVTKEHLVTLADLYLNMLIDPGEVREGKIEYQFDPAITINFLPWRVSDIGKRFQITKFERSDSITIRVIPLPGVSRLNFLQANEHALEFLESFIAKLRTWHSIEADFDLKDLKSSLLP